MQTAQERTKARQGLGKVGKGKVLIDTTVTKEFDGT